MAELPQFSRNYGSKGGAYENPVTAIDYSGREYARAINSIGNSVAKVIEEKTKRNSAAVKETQGYLDYNAKFVLENYDEFSNNMEKVGVNNPSLNKAGLFAIEKKAQAYMAMKSSTSKELQMEAAREYALWDGKINELTQLVEAGKEADQSFNADYITDYSKVNTEGGVSTVNQNTNLSKQYQLAMPARIGATRNPEEQWFFDEDDNWKIKTAYSSEQITKAYKDGQISTNYVVADPKVLFTFDGGRVPNITADKNKFRIDSGIINKNGEFADSYVGEPELRKTENGQFEYTYRPIKFEDIKTASTPFITAQINSFIKHPDQANNLWNHQLQQGKNILDPETGKQLYPDGFKLESADGQVGTAFNSESSDVFGKAYTAWFLEDIIKKGGNASNYRKITPDEPTDAELRARRKEAKATEKDKKKKEYLDKTYDIDRLKNLNQVIKLAQDEGLKVEEFEDPNDGIEVEGKAITPGTSPRERRKILLIASGIDAATADEMAGEDSAPFGPSQAPSTYKGVSF